jgi:hypothetical protein
MRKAPNLSRPFYLGFSTHCFVHSFYPSQQIALLISIGVYFFNWLITKAAAFKFTINVRVESFIPTAFIFIFQGQEALQPCSYCPKRATVPGSHNQLYLFTFFNLQFQVQFRVPSLALKSALKEALCLGSTQSTQSTILYALCYLLCALRCFILDISDGIALLIHLLKFLLPTTLRLRDSCGFRKWVSMIFLANSCLSWVS